MERVANERIPQERELLALEHIERNPSISQRQLARELGVALGVANACVRTLVRKGLVKVRGDSNRSITYHLTHEGVIRKAALAVQWTNNTISDYAAARGRVRRQLEAIASRGIVRIVVLGADEAAELVALIAPHAGLEAVAAVDLGGRRIGDVLAGVPVLMPGECATFSLDAALVASNDALIEVFRSAVPDVPVFDLGGRKIAGGTS
ncbi:MAG: winged helix-turn-helix domain-containing protein [Coriobacteriia bacterium]|nr:winged helix-turn-helix domain-containing protein [Coriobacteriia bacterium]